MEERKRPEPIKDFQTTDLGHNVYAVMAPPMRFFQYLILGQEKALLIDTGFGVGSLKKVVDALTRLPIILLNTHGHPDHVGGNAEFGAPLLHPADNDLYAAKGSLEFRQEEAAMWRLELSLQPTPPAPVPVEDGTVIDLGGRTLTVLHTPGHTRGSVCVLDGQTGWLFSGDNVQKMTALTEPWAANVSDYLASLKRLEKLPVRAIYTGHMPNLLPPETIGEQIRCCEAILAGEQGEPFHRPMGSGWAVVRGQSGVSYAEGKNQ